jgi:hypothetical protein
MSIYYVYAYSRSKNSIIAPKGTPYYVGKGSNGRAYDKRHAVSIPKDKSNIVFLESNLSENKAFEIEKFLIGYYGRIDLGTGILRNRTDGGEGSSGYKWSNESKSKMSVSMKGKNKGEKCYWYGKTGKSHPMYGKTGEKNSMYGKQHSIETKEKFSISRKGKYGGENNSMYGKQHSIETKEKMSASKLNMPIVTCPHCGKSGTHNMKRYHFGNCKHLIENLIIVL